MSKPKDFFPFPSEKKKKVRDTFPVESEETLPPFPGTESQEPQLTSEELTIIREMIYDYKSTVVKKDETAESTKEKLLFYEQIPGKGSFETLPIPEIEENTQTGISRNNLLSSLAIAANSQEIEYLHQLKKLAESIPENEIFVKTVLSIASVFPVGDYLRHGTPDQKLYTLIAIGDRFLEHISGINFNSRKKLIKIIGKYLSQVSGAYNFIQMENESFNPQYHERVSCSSSTGSKIREMRGFVVVERNNNQIVRLGRVLT